MSNPVVTNVEIVYPNGQVYISPGQTCEVIISAFDPDNYVIDVTVNVRDKLGNITPVTCTPIVADAVEYVDATVSPETATIMQDPTQPNKFFVTAGM